MMRNLIVLGCAGLLAIGLSVSSFAGLEPDTDNDGLVDSQDNCVLDPNGPNGSTGFCNTQLDGDSDGYGNPCDTDTNNDGATGLNDVGATLIALSNPYNANFDYNCDLGIGINDVGTALIDVGSNPTPGPSGLACAGSVPCP